MHNIPKSGVCITVQPHHFTQLKTEEPVIRIVHDGEKWVATDPSEKRGLIVFVRHPYEVVSRITEVTIVSTKERTAFAIAKL
jgi:hypothetical protein